MPSAHGQFIWYELMCTDAAAATEFYRSVIGWRARDAGADHVRYTILSANETDIGGLVEMPRSVCDAGGKPGWIGYIGADDVDATAKRVHDAGGTIHRPAEDIPGIGRFAVVADPQGAVFTLFKPTGTAPSRPAANTNSAPDAGHIGWHELHATDPQSAFAFYATLFGWTKTEAIDMGPMGTYQTFATNQANGCGMVGGMMATTDRSSRTPPGCTDITVDNIAAAVTRVTGAGGTLIHGPQPVPGGLWVAQCLDPQGILFAMVGPNPGSASQP